MIDIMVDILIVLVSILIFGFYNLYRIVKDLQQQVNALDKEQHEQNKELMESFKFQQQQAVLNEAIIDKMVEMQSGSNIQKYYGIVGEA